MRANRHSHKKLSMAPLEWLLTARWLDSRGWPARLTVGEGSTCSDSIHSTLPPWMQTRALLCSTVCRVELIIWVAHCGALEGQRGGGWRPRMCGLRALCFAMTRVIWLLALLCGLRATRDIGVFVRRVSAS